MKKDDDKARRTVFGAFCTTASAMLVLAMFLLFTALTSCSSETSDIQSNERYFNFYNWGDYIDEELLDMFTEETGIKVVLDMYSSNEEMYTKINSGASDYDLAIPSDYMIDKMRNEGLLEKIDFNNIPNFDKIDERFLNLAYDERNEYSVPYFCGTIGILYNKTMVTDVVDSWGILWDQKYKGDIFLYDSMRNTVYIALKLLGYDCNTNDPNELMQARDLLMEGKQYVQCYINDMVRDKMVLNEGALATVFSGDAKAAKSVNEDLEYVIPKEGSCIWVDAMVIPKGAKHKAEAEEFINFMCRPDVSLINTEYIEYTTTNKEVLQDLPEEWQNDNSYWPSDEEFERCSDMFLDLGDTIKIYDRLWTEVLSY